MVSASPQRYVGMTFRPQPPRITGPSVPGAKVHLVPTRALLSVTPNITHPRRLDHTEWRMGRNDSLQPEVGRAEDPPILLLRAPMARLQDQHVQIHRLRRARPIVRRDDHLDYQRFAIRGERTMADLEQTSSSLIIQNAQDLLEQV